MKRDVPFSALMQNLNLVVVYSARRWDWVVCACSCGVEVCCVSRSGVARSRCARGAGLRAGPLGAGSRWSDHVGRITLSDLSGRLRRRWRLPGSSTVAPAIVFPGSIMNRDTCEFTRSAAAGEETSSVDGTWSVRPVVPRPGRGRRRLTICQGITTGRERYDFASRTRPFLAAQVRCGWPAEGRRTNGEQLVVLPQGNKVLRSSHFHSSPNTSLS